MHALPSTLLILLLLAPQESKTQVRTPVPDAAKQREAEKAIRELYKAEYAKKVPADREALIRTLLMQSQKSQDDPAAQFVFYREAQDLASQSGYVDLAFEAIDGAASIFDIDAVVLKNFALAAAAKSAKSPEDLGKVVDGYLTLADAALKTDDYEGAEKAVAGALLVARRANSVPLATRVGARQKEILDLKVKFDKVKKAMEALAKDPENAAANFEVGFYCCFVKADWVTGLPLLAKGSDPGLKSLAAKELQRPTEPSARIDLADGWWDLAEKEKNEARQRILTQRAVALYEQTLSEVSGLLLTKVQLRLESYRRRIFTKDGVSITFELKPVSRGILLRDNDDGLYEPAVVGGKPCLKLSKADNSRYLYLKLSEPWPESWKSAEVEVEYYDDGAGSVDLQYDGASGAYAGCPKSATLGSSKSWKVLTNPIVNPIFKGRQNAAADMRICHGGGDLYIRRVTLRLTQK